MIDETRIIRDLSNHIYDKNEFIDLIKSYNQKGYDFFIGTDSQVFSKHVSVVTAICPRRIDDFSGQSGRVFYIKERLDRKEIQSLRARMLLEAYRSIETAMDLDPYITTKISIHLDVGSSGRSKTSMYQQELQYLVTAQGYECKIKPESWAAGGVADRFSKS